MRLIKGGSSLDSKLMKLVRKHKHVAFAVAWASSENNSFSEITSAKEKIYKAVIGTHFYQTHPDVLDKFIDFEKCHFIFQPKGIFHPKVYLFWSKSCWDLLIGSANLTNGALTNNTELLIHVSNKDSDKKLRSQAKQIITDYWDQGYLVTDREAQRYRDLWELQQSALCRVSGKYGSSSTGKSKTPVHTEIMSMSWAEFLKKVRAD